MLNDVIKREKKRDLYFQSTEQANGFPRTQKFGPRVGNIRVTMESEQMTLKVWFSMGNITLLWTGDPLE